MPLRRLADETGGCDPETIRKLSDVLDSVWADVGGQFEGQPPEDIEKARTVIARTLLYHWDNGHREAPVLSALALEALAQVNPKITV